MQFPMPLHGFRLFLAILTLCSGIGTAAQTDERQLMLPENSLDPFVFMDPEIFTSGQAPAEVFQVFVGGQDQCCGGRTPMAGTYEVIDEGWSFSPQFELIEGQSYVVRTAFGDGFDLTEFDLSMGGSRHTLPIVTAVYPSGPHIPENTLRFYIHFSEPMKPHVASEYVRLVDAAGHVDDAAFMQFKQELWSADRRRLTVLMDPGRIKRGVSQNLTLGPALEQGQNYSLVVAAGWPEAASDRTLERFEQSFRVAEPLRTVPDIAAWGVVAPRVGSRDPILVLFDRPFDSAQLLSEIDVLFQSGETVEGRYAVSNGERVWAFTPDHAWEDEDITLVVDPSLEDVAGNNFHELLDHVLGTSEVEVDDLRLRIELTDRNSKS